MRSLYFLGLLLVVSFTVSAQSKLSPYSQLIVTSHQSAISFSQKNQFVKQFGLKEQAERTRVNAYLHVNQGYKIEQLKAEEVHIACDLDSILIINLPIDKIERVSSIPEVSYLEVGQPIDLKMTEARIKSFVNEVHLGTNLKQPYTGKGIVVGIIDLGFQFDHIHFRDLTNGAIRIKRILQQNSNGYINPIEYKTPEEILAAQTDDPSQSHGTHVAGIATGSFSKNGLQGTAPEADIVLVGFDQRDGSLDSPSLTSAIKYIFDYAQSVSKPCVINLSLGRSIGPHDGTSTFDTTTDALSGSGRIVVGSAANSGGLRCHISKVFDNNPSPLSTKIDFVNTPNRSTIDIWGEIEKDYKVTVTIKNGEEQIFSSEGLLPSVKKTKSYSFTSTSKTGEGMIFLSSDINPKNNRPNVFISSRFTGLPIGYTMHLNIEATSGSVHAWIDDSYSTFNNGDSNYSINETGGTGKSIISVGAYTSSNTYTNIDGKTFYGNQAIDKIATFSSKGPTLDGRVKPDITAPGSIVKSSYSKHIYNQPSSKERTVSKVSFENKDYYFGVFQGTSMASPFVAGVIATWLEADPTLTPTRIREIFKKTAIRDEHTGVIPEVGSNTWGYGKIDALNGIKEILRTTNLTSTQFDNKIRLLNYQGDRIQLFFPQATNEAQIRIFNLNGQAISTQQLRNLSIGEIREITTPNVGAQLLLLEVQSSEGVQTFKARQ